MIGRYLLVAIAGCVAMSGCTRVQEAMMPVPDKVNAAYPLAPDVRVAQERLQSLLGANAEAAKTLKSQIDARMTLRALTCTKNIQIGRTDSVASVRAKPVDMACLQDQDAGLQAFYGARTVGELLARPPLRAFKPLGAARMVSAGKLRSIDAVVLASDANVGVVRDTGGDGVVLEMPGGQPIATLPSRPYGKDAISPNGRVVAASAQQTLVFLDAETGSRIWEVPDTERFVDWLSPLQSVLFATRKGELMIADGANGTIDAHPLSGRRTYGITLSQQPSRILLGAYGDWAVVEHTRTPEGIQAAAVRQLPIDRGARVSIPQENVLLMRGSTLLAFPWQSDIGWVDLKTGAAGRWRISPYFDTAFAQTDDTHLLLTSNDPKGRATWSFDIDAQTVTPVESLPSAVYLRRVGQRHGYLLRSRDAWIGDEVTSKGEAADLHKTVADYALQLQLNRLQQLIDAEKAAAAAPVSSAAFGTASVRGTTGNGGVTSATNPALANVSADAQVHMVGVYEGKRDARSLATPGVSSARERRDVRVIVRPAPRPVVLVLSSYEPVNWVVENRGAQLAAVLLSGYHPSSVTGASAVPLLRIGSAYAYANGGGGYEALRRSVVQYTGTREIRSFQGTYMGSEFVVGG